MTSQSAAARCMPLGRWHSWRPGASGYLFGGRRRDLADDEIVAARRVHDLLNVHAHRIGVDHDDIAGARIADDGTEQDRPGQIGQGIGGRRHGWFLRPGVYGRSNGHPYCTVALHGVPLAPQTGTFRHDYIRPVPAD